MSDKSVPNNVLQFPGKKRDSEEQSSQPGHPAVPPKLAPAKGRKGKAASTIAVLAIAFATGAVNHFAFQGPVMATDLASTSVDPARGIASVDAAKWTRDADWEKQLAERLAAPQVRDLASVGIGHAPTREDKLHWGTLEEYYHFSYSEGEGHNIKSIDLPDPTTTPAYVSDRNKFLSDYGTLFFSDYDSAVLKSVEVSHDTTIELFTLLDKDKRPSAEVRFTLDNFKRLLSLKVEPKQI